MAATGSVPFAPDMDNAALISALNTLADQTGAIQQRVIGAELEIIKLRDAAGDAVRQLVSRGEAGFGQTRADMAAELQSLADGLAGSLRLLVTNAQQEFAAHRDELTQAGAAFAALQARVGALEGLARAAPVSNAAAAAAAASPNASVPAPAAALAATGAGPTAPAPASAQAYYWMVGWWVG